MKGIFVGKGMNKAETVKTYARGAIAELSRQLADTTTASRVVKLRSRIGYWQNVLESKEKIGIAEV